MKQYCGIQVVVGRAPEEKLHFTGVVVLEQGEGQGMRTAVDGSGPVGGIGHEDIYRVYFHGPAYRVLEMVNRLATSVSPRSLTLLWRDLGAHVITVALLRSTDHS